MLAGRGQTPAGASGCLLPLGKVARPPSAQLGLFWKGIQGRLFLASESLTLDNCSSSGNFQSLFPQIPRGAAGVGWGRGRRGVSLQGEARPPGSPAEGQRADGSSRDSATRVAQWHPPPLPSAPRVDFGATTLSWWPCLQTRGEPQRALGPSHSGSQDAKAVGEARAQGSRARQNQLPRL